MKMFFEEIYSSKSFNESTDFGESDSIDLSKILTLSALVPTNSNTSELLATIDSLKNRIDEQNKQLLWLQDEKDRQMQQTVEEKTFEESLNEELNDKVIDVSKKLQEKDIELQVALTNIEKLEKRVQSTVDENIELKLQLLLELSKKSSIEEQEQQQHEVNNSKQESNTLVEEIVKLKELISKNFTELKMLQKINSNIPMKKNPQTSLNSRHKTSQRRGTTRIPKLIKRITTIVPKTVKLIDHATQHEELIEPPRLLTNDELLMNIEMLPNISCMKFDPIAFETSDQRFLRPSLDVIRESSISDLENQIEEKLESMSNFLMEISQKNDIQNFIEDIDG